MTTVLQAYDRACAALEQASTVDDVMGILDKLKHVKLHGRSVQDRVLIERATVLQLRAERRLGAMLKDLEDAGRLGVGRKAKDDDSRVTLDEIGISKSLSSLAQRTAALDDEAFEDLVEATRERIRSRKAIVVDPVSDGPVRGSRAVMSSRAEPDDSLDYFPTPPWATRALIAHVLPLLGVDCGEYLAWEPACGEGHIAEVLAESFADTIATDIFDYGYGRILDFLSDAARDQRVDWIITNPPFGDKAEEFTLRALAQARHGVAMFVRLQWLETIGRYENLFFKHRPTVIAFFAERVNLCKGRWDPDGGTATAYIWLVWSKYDSPLPPFWIPPGCRERLSKPDDVDRFTSRPVIRKLKAKMEGEAA